MTLLYGWYLLWVLEFSCLHVCLIAISVGFTLLVDGYGYLLAYGFHIWFEAVLVHCLTGFLSYEVDSCLVAFLSHTNLVDYCFCLLSADFSVLGLLASSHWVPLRGNRVVKIDTPLVSGRLARDLGESRNRDIFRFPLTWP